MRLHVEALWPDGKIWSLPVLVQNPSVLQKGAQTTLDGSETEACLEILGYSWPFSPSRLCSLFLTSQCGAEASRAWGFKVQVE